MDDLTPVRLRDGTKAVVVPLLLANREALQQEYERLSPETRFSRFLAAVPELTEKDGTELPLGLARIIRYPDDPTAADVAVTVVDAWHGRGVPTALLEVLMRQRPRGVERIVTVIDAGNRASLAMLRRLGEVEVSQPESGTQRVVVELQTARPVSADRGTAGASGHTTDRRTRLPDHQRVPVRGIDGQP